MLPFQRSQGSFVLSTQIRRLTTVPVTLTPRDLTPLVIPVQLKIPVHIWHTHTHRDKYTYAYVTWTQKERERNKNKFYYLIYLIYSMPQGVEQNNTLMEKNDRVILI